MIICGNNYYIHRYGGQFIDNRYGAGSGTIWLDSVRCTGTETNITNCRHSDWGSHDCGHSQDVSISCIPGIQQFAVFGLSKNAAN